MLIHHNTWTYEQNQAKKGKQKLGLAKTLNLSRSPCLQGIWNTSCCYPIAYYNPYLTLQSAYLTTTSTKAAKMASWPRPPYRARGQGTRSEDECNEKYTIKLVCN